MQYLFDGTEKNFKWTPDGWYSFDNKKAQIEALKERNERAKELISMGYQVRKFSLGTQLRSFGGIGSGKPHIEIVTKCYGVNAYQGE